MSRKWLEHESPRWVRENIITSEQAQQLLSLYDEKKRAAYVLPILGSILVGLGILTFVAANWQDIGQLWRIVILLVAMTGFYAAGERFHRGGERKLGLALTGIGLMAFGASIFLVQQMFHMVYFHSYSFVIWGAAGVMMTWLYRSGYLFVLAAIILNIAGWYSIDHYQSISYLTLALLIAGLGAYGWRYRQVWLSWLLGISILLQSLMLIAVQDWNIAWFLLLAAVMYVLGDWVRDRLLTYPLQGSALTAVYIFGSLMVLVSREIPVLRFSGTERMESVIYVSVLGLLFALSLLAKARANRLLSGFDWLLLAPWFFIPGGSDVLYLLALCFFSLYVLWQGYNEEWRFKINLGTILFLFAVLLAYTRMAWAFMDKSLFFLTGGVLLLLLSWYLNRRRSRFMQGREL